MLILGSAITDDDIIETICLTTEDSDNGEEPETEVKKVPTMEARTAIDSLIFTPLIIFVHVSSIKCLCI